MTRHYLRIILDILFPPSAHEQLLRTVTPQQFTHHYLPCTYDKTITLASYNSRTVQAAVAACKFEKNIHAARLLSTLLFTWLEMHPVAGETILIPIPLSEARERERGFNQVTRVLDYAVTLPRHRLKKNWLIRTIDTTRQTSLGRQARLKNMRGAFAISPQLNQVEWAGISRIIICDDVMTTGATLEAARIKLREAVPKYVTIICLAWAH